MNKDKLLKLISLYEEVIHGTEDKMGLMDCVDGYYNNGWDRELVKIERIKYELNLLEPPPRVKE